MQKKKGISLIVLVITIIVMIILAGAIILSLNNAGIIGKANEAVDATNEATIRQLVELKWAEAYLDENVAKTDAGMYNAVMEKLTAENIDLTLYDIQVTAKGTTVEKIPTVQELQSMYEFKYYSSVAKAIEDINAGTVGTENSVADADKNDAFAGAYIDGDDLTVVVLKDATGEHALQTALKIGNNVTINLGGHTIEFQNQLGISGYYDDATYRITIDGRLPGSKLELYSNTSMTRLLQTANDEFVINGGTYVANTAEQVSGSLFVGQVVFVASEEASKMQINDAQLIFNMLFEGTGETITQDYLIVACVHSYGGETEINNCTLITDATKLPDGFKYNKRTNIKGVEVAAGYTEINGTLIKVVSKTDVVTGQRIYVTGVDVADELGNAVLVDSDIVIASEVAKNEYAKGIDVDSGGECEAIRTNITVGAVSDNDSFGIYNESGATTKLTACIINGADVEWWNAGTLYVNGIAQTKTAALIPQNLLEKRKYC